MRGALLAEQLDKPHSTVRASTGRVLDALPGRCLPAGSRLPSVRARQPASGSHAAGLLSCSSPAVPPGLPLQMAFDVHRMACDDSDSDAAIDMLQKWAPSFGAYPLACSPACLPDRQTCSEDLPRTKPPCPCYWPSVPCMSAFHKAAY